jgi:hypothetical protein
METRAVRADQLRAAEAARAEEREGSRGQLEAQAHVMCQQGTDLRQFADAKVDEPGGELATASKTEAELHAALPSGNQRLAKQVSSMQLSLKRAEHAHDRLQSEYAHCGDSLGKPEAELRIAQISSVRVV